MAANEWVLFTDEVLYGKIYARVHFKLVRRILLHYLRSLKSCTEPLIPVITRIINISLESV